MLRDFEVQSLKQNRSTEGCSKLQRSVDMTLEQVQVPKGTVPGVRMSKRPLFASRTRCDVVAMFYGNLHKLVIRSKSVIRSISEIGLQIGVMSDQLRVPL